VKTVEGGKDDISAPGQCVAALDLCTGLPDSKKANHLEPGRPQLRGHLRHLRGQAELAQQHPARWCSTSSTPIATCPAPEGAVASRAASCAAHWAHAFQAAGRTTRSSTRPQDSQYARRRSKKPVIKISLFQSIHRLFSRFSDQ
jgi:hypothetical protein